eukprot:gnl/Spiro4/23238_TR11480_c0_g1_i1.p1 gnl/Spiro4/23238_TR11480_c0_g1~~gnl/Spiro4/23238_TR11480_c0_g1_i1.p1  ORF type:complete len:164 (-),score=4.92 gnl/Spiro4/23238_TR11480_c0_g1_i1:85-576(-)
MSDATTASIAEFISSHASDNVIIQCDIQDHRLYKPTFPCHIHPTALRPDLVLFTSSDVWIIELTVPAEHNASAANIRKQQRYEALVTLSFHPSLLTGSARWVTLVAPKNTSQTASDPHHHFRLPAIHVGLLAHRAELQLFYLANPRQSDHAATLSSAGLSSFC